MKKQLLFLLIFISTLFSYAQFSLTVNGTPTENGDEIIVNTIDATADREFVLTNLNPTLNINTFIEIVSITNSDGSHLTLCYDLCYYGVTVGEHYPENNPIVILAGQSSFPHGNHFQNEGLGDDPNQPIVYELKFYEVDGSGSEIGTPITIFYKYSPNTASIEDNNQINFELYPTVATSNFKLQVNEKVNLQIFSIQGKLVKQTTVNQGLNVIDVSNLSTQTYFVKITNEEGKISKTKLIIK